jgi:hypothetical protein
MTTSESTDRPGGSVLKTALGVAIVAIAIAAVAVGLFREADHAREAEQIAATPAATSAIETAPGAKAHQPNAVIVYYFHGDYRCETCLAIESQTVRAVETNFADEIDAGRLRLEIVNFDAPANRHFRADYNLAFGTVLVQGAGEAWENLDNVWDLVHEDPADFETYLVDQIRPMLDAAG